MPDLAAFNKLCDMADTKGWQVGIGTSDKTLKKDRSGFYRNLTDLVVKVADGHILHERIVNGDLEVAARQLTRRLPVIP